MLGKGQGLLQALRDGADESGRLLAQLQAGLPEELAAQVWGATLRAGTLTLLVRSSAWGARLRYHPDAGPEACSRLLGAEVVRVVVKVRAGR